MLTAVQINAALTATGAAGVQSAIRGVGTEAEATGRKMGLMKRFMGSFLGQQLIFGLISKAIAVLDQQVRDVFTKTNEWDAALAQMNAVLASTKDVSGMTAQSMIALADSLSTTTTYNNTAVLSAENLIATFTSIGKDIFPQTTVAVLNMATALKEDTKSAAIQLGKALQDPILGVTALRRVGVNFSKDNQEMLKRWVETGQTARAQKFILDEITREFGGSASAAAGTFSGKLQVLSNQFDIVKEAIGNALIPVLSRLFTTLAPGVTMIGERLPAALHAAGQFFRDYLATPLRDLKDIIGDVFGAIGQLLGGFGDAQGKTDDLGRASRDAHDALKAIGDFIKGTLTPAMRPLGEAIGTVVTKLLDLGQWVRDNKPALAAIATFFGVVMVNNLRLFGLAAIQAGIKFAAAFPEVYLVAAALAALVAVIVIVVTHWKQITEALGHFKDMLGNVLGGIGDFIGSVLGTLGDAADKILDLLTWPFRVVWDHIGPFIKGLVKGILGFDATILGIFLRFGQLVLGLLTFPFRFAWAFISPLLGFIFGKIGEAVGFIAGKLGELGGLIAGAIGNSIGSTLARLGAFKDILGNVAGVLGNFVGGALKSFGDAWKGLGDIIGGALGGLANIIKAPLNGIIWLINKFIDFLDSLQIHIPSISVGPVSTPAFDWNGMGIPKIPYLAKGGVLGFGSAVVGEKGPELLTMGKGGAMVTPLGTQHLGAGMGKGAGGDVHIHVHAPQSFLTPPQLVASVRRALFHARGSFGGR